MDKAPKLLSSLVLVGSILALASGAAQAEFSWQTAPVLEQAQVLILVMSWSTLGRYQLRFLTTASPVTRFMAWDRPA